MAFDASREAEKLEGIAGDLFQAQPHDVQASKRLCDEWQQLSRAEKREVAGALFATYGHGALQPNQAAVDVVCVVPEGSASPNQIGDLETVTFSAPQAAHPGADAIEIIDDGDKTKIRTNNISVEVSKRDRAR
jgi:predicted component of type VI protein secretion system